MTRWGSSSPSSIDEIVRFASLTQTDLERIVRIQLDIWRKRLADRRIGLDVTDAAMAHLAREGFDPAFGARPLKRIIQREIGDPAAVLLLEGKVQDGGTIPVDAPPCGEGLTVTVCGASGTARRVWLVRGPGWKFQTTEPRSALAASHPLTPIVWRDQ